MRREATLSGGAERTHKNHHPTPPTLWKFDRERIRIPKVLPEWSQLPCVQRSCTNSTGVALRRLGRPEGFRQPVMIELEQQHRKLSSTSDTG